eukprot:gene4928-8525_t
MGQGSIAESVDEYQPIVLDPEMIMVVQTGVTACCSTKEEGKLLVATSQGTITLYDIEEKKKLKIWEHNKRLTNIMYNEENNTFYTNYFSLEGEDPKIFDGLVGSYVAFLDTVAARNMKTEMLGDGVLLWNFDSDKPERFIGGRFPVVHKHQNKLLLQRKPGLIEEYCDGEFKTFIDAKITKYIILCSMGKELVGVVSGTADIYLWDENKKPKKIHDGDGSEDLIIRSICCLAETHIIFAVNNYVYFIELSSKRMRSFAAHEKKISTVTWISEEFLITADVMGNVKFWDVLKIKAIFPNKTEKKKK